MLFIGNLNVIKNNKTSILKQILLNLSNYLDLERKQIERKKKDTCLILHDAVTPLSTLLVSEIKMVTQRYCD